MASFKDYTNKSTAVTTTKAPSNKGGFWGGLEYLGEKLAVGAMQSIEGIWDYSAGGIADFFGADEWAEKQMNKDWFGDWYDHPDEWFNPAGGWKTAGDVAGGIGSSLPAIGAAALAAGITIATAGAASPVAVGLTSAAVAGLGAAGTATKEAYRESGELSGKEWGYGALVGGTEAALEYATAGIGSGGGKAIKALGNIGRKGAAEAAEGVATAAARSGLSSIVGKTVKHIGGDFISEAAEEGIAEIMAPIYARATYDPSAEYATAEEIAYAAFVGGLSGVIMGGTTAGAQKGASYISNARFGREIRKQGYEGEIIGVAKRIADAESKNRSGYSVMEEVREIVQELGDASPTSSASPAPAESTTPGTAPAATPSTEAPNATTTETTTTTEPTTEPTTDASNARLGRLAKLTAVTRVLPQVEEAAINILNDVATAVEQYRATTGDDITAEQLTEGLPDDFSERPTSTKEEKKARLHELRRALSTNPRLLNLALASATGRMMVNAEAFADRTAAGQLMSREQYEAFLEQAPAQKKAAVAKIIGTDDLSTVSYEKFRDAMFGYAAEHAPDIMEVRSMRAAARAAAPNERAIPAAIATTLLDGVHRYGHIAVIKQGDSIRLYDYTTDNISRRLTALEATAELQRLRRQGTGQTASQEDTAEREKAQAEVAELDAWAGENLKGYNELTGREKRTVRSMIRRARALGVSDSDVKMCAQVSVRSGIRIEFRKSIDSNGFYDRGNNMIVLNPNAKHNASRLLIHELAHALYTTERGQKILDKYRRQMDKDRADEIRKRYGEAGLSEHAAEEIAAHYAEDVLGNRDTMERMLREEPTLGDKVLSFFKLAKTDYKGNERLSRAAGRLYNHFSKLFAEFSARNRGGLIAEGMTSGVRYSVDGDLPKITIGMSDADRAEILRQKTITPGSIKAIDVDGIDLNSLENEKRRAVVNTLLKKLKALGAIKAYSTDAVDVQFEFTTGGFRKSVNSQLVDYGGSLADFTKVVLNMQSILDNAVLLEIHSDKAKGTPRENPQLMQTYVLLSAFFDGGNVSPVQFEIKRYIDEQNRLYLAVALTKIEADVFEDTVTDKRSPTLLLPASTYSIPQFIEKINPLDENFFKYIPDEMLNNEQIAAKRRALRREAEKYGRNPDLRYSLPEDEDFEELFAARDDEPAFDPQKIIARGVPQITGPTSLTVGEIQKLIANNTRQKVYSKKEVMELVGEFSGADALSPEIVDEIGTAVWQILNRQPDPEYRQAVAHDIAEYVVARIVNDTVVESPDSAEARSRLEYLRLGVGSLTFTKSEIAEIQLKYGKDGARRFLGRWGNKNKGGAVGADVFASSIAELLPADFAYLADMAPIDALFVLAAAYESDLKTVGETVSTYEDATDADLLGMVADIEHQILEAYDTKGGKSKFARYVEDNLAAYVKKIARLEGRLSDERLASKLSSLIEHKASRMRDLKIGTFANATQHTSDTFKNTIGALSKISHRGLLNVTGTRKHLRTLYDWYTSDDAKKGVLGYENDSKPGMYVQGVADMLDALTTDDNGNVTTSKSFSNDDLAMLLDVMTYFVTFVENYGKVYRQGRWIEALPEAKRYVGLMQDNQKIRGGVRTWVAGSAYMQTFGDPMTVARRMDMYQDGFYTEMMQELRDAAIDAKIAEMEVREEYDAFVDEHKRYMKTATETVTYDGVEIPRMHLIGLYMTMRRKHAWAGIAFSGYQFKVGGKTVRVKGTLNENATEAELEQYISEKGKAIDKLLTEEDKAYIAILERVYNEKARALKVERDMQRLGFTNATQDYYYPIRRANIAKSIDASDIVGEMDRVSNASFNKNTVKGARQELIIESADTVFSRHTTAVCQYAYLSPAIEAFDTLYNLDISGNRNRPVSVATESGNTWERGQAYFRKMISDIQGIPASSSEGMKLLGAVRGGYAKFQLGANPKVWLTQLSSLFAASSILDSTSILRGMTISSQGIDEYCPLAKLRNQDNSAAMAQGVLDKKPGYTEADGRAARAAGAVAKAAKATAQATGKVGDLSMIPIGKMDRFVVRWLFGACQAQVERDGGAKVGTDENKREAGKLLRKVILETQQNAFATERSAAMRSGNEILRMFTMFSADGMKAIGRVIDGFGECAVLRSRIKIATDATEIASLKQSLKSAKWRTAKATIALIFTAAYMAAIAQLFRWLYDKEQEEGVVETMLVDAVGNLFGGLPLFRDIYGKLAEGYDVNNYAYSALNDLLDSAVACFNVVKDLTSGESTTQDINRALKNLAYSGGQVLGLPTRNLYNAFYGLTKRFSPTTAYTIDSAFYEKNYKSDLEKYLEKGDSKMVSFTMGLLLDDETCADVSKGVFNELVRLTKDDRKVIPRSTPEKVTMDGVEHELTLAETSAYEKTYAGYADALSTLMGGNWYRSLDNAAKEEAINFVYDLYREKSMYAAGLSEGSRSLAISYIIPDDVLAMAHVSLRGIESDKDKNGNTVSGSKRKKVVEAINRLKISKEQKILLLVRYGYTPNSGDIKGVSDPMKLLARYIASAKGLKKAEKIALAEACGLEVKNGVIKNK